MTVSKHKIALLAMVSVLLMAGCSSEQEPPQTPFGWGVAFASSREEVIYRRGKPSSVVEFIDSREVAYPITGLPDGRSVESFERWVYSDPVAGKWVTLDFTQNKVTGLTCLSDYGSSFGCVYRGLSSGYGSLGDGRKSSEDDVRQKLGNPDWEEIGDGQKVMSYERLGAIFYLTRGQVDMIQLIKP